MRALLMPALLAGTCLCASASVAMAMDAMTDEQIIASAESAAPPSVAKHAKIIAFDADMNQRTVREGTNGFTCMPNDPHTPGADPMCADKGGMEWIEAWASHTDPPKGVIGFAYMLAGGSDADNMDPYASGPPAGQEWTAVGPHIMIFNVGDMVNNYPTGKQPDITAPYVMYPGTPYAHIMVPVR